jgi:hypothetical protein
VWTTSNAGGAQQRLKRSQVGRHFRRDVVQDRDEPLMAIVRTCRHLRGYQHWCRHSIRRKGVDRSSHPPRSDLVTARNREASRRRDGEGAPRQALPTRCPGRQLLNLEPRCFRLIAGLSDHHQSASISINQHQSASIGDIGRWKITEAPCRAQRCRLGQNRSATDAAPRTCRLACTSHGPSSFKLVLVPSLS